MDSRQTSSRTGSVSRVFEVARNGTQALPASRRGLRIQVLRGTLVVTQTRDPEDHVLVAGDVLTLPAGGLVVAWALQPAAFAVQGAVGADLSQPVAHAA